MKKFLIGLAMVGVASSAVAGQYDGYSSNRAGPDGYHFSGGEYTKTELKVTMVYARSYDEMVKMFQQTHSQVYKAVIQPGNVVKAFSVINKETDTCTIYVIHPSVSYNPELIGHELLHCSMGRWHKEK